MRPSAKQEKREDGPKCGLGEIKDIKLIGSFYLHNFQTVLITSADNTNPPLGCAFQNIEILWIFHFSSAFLQFLGLHGTTHNMPLYVCSDWQTVDSAWVCIVHEGLCMRSLFFCCFSKKKRGGGVWGGRRKRRCSSQAERDKDQRPGSEFCEP